MICFASLKLFCEVIYGIITTIEKVKIKEIKECGMLKIILQITKKL